MATTSEQVRVLTGLTASELPDATIEALLDLNDGFVKLAAADALEQYAGSLLTVTAESDDIKIDGSKRAAVFMSRAARLREQAAAAAGDDGFFFDIVDSPHLRPELTERPAW